MDWSGWGSGDSGEEVEVEVEGEGDEEESCGGGRMWREDSGRETGDYFYWGRGGGGC